MIRRFFQASPFSGTRFRLRGLAVSEPMPPGIINRPAGLGDYLIMYFHQPVVAGAGLGAPVRPGKTLYVWIPGEHQVYGSADRTYVHSWIHCEGTLVDRFLKTGSIRAAVPLTRFNATPFLQFLDRLNAEASQPEPNETIAANLFENWATDLLRQLAGSGKVIPARLKRAKEYLDLHFTKSLTLEELAELAHWSVPHFSEQFREYFHTSPMNYVIQERLKAAVYLLSDIHLSVGEVARRVGYEDVYHFSKLFRRHVGVSPGAYRRRTAA